MLNDYLQMRLRKYHSSSLLLDAPVSFPLPAPPPAASESIVYQ